MRWQELERALSHIREGRYHRARAIVSSLNSLKKPVEWGHVIEIAGAGVAPGRVHIARALVEAGHVCNLREAFSKYLYDGGPASAS
jgi:predicted metal-dependent phosphoesterase TrpH